MVRTLVTAALVVACKSNEPPPAPPATDVVVVTPGAAPLRAVRYAVAKGTHTTVELATDWKVSAGEIGNTLPTIVTTFDIACEDVGRDGSMKLRATVLDAAAHERPDSGITAAAITAQLEPLKGTAMVLTLAPDGRVSPPTFEMPVRPAPVPAGSAGSGSGSAGSGSAGSGSAGSGSAGSGSSAPAVAPSAGSGTGTDAAIKEQLSALAASFQQLAMPLPTAPVGVGAKWRTSRKLDQNGMQLTTVTTLEVTALDGKTLAFTLTSEVHGADQTINQEGLSVELKDVTGSATGKGTIDLTKGVTTGELHFDLHSQMTAAGSSTPMRAQTDIVIH